MLASSPSLVGLPVIPNPRTDLVGSPRRSYRLEAQPGYSLNVNVKRQRVIVFFFTKSNDARHLTGKTAATFPASAIDMNRQTPPITGKNRAFARKSD
jgi:hypothetical protein